MGTVTDVEAALKQRQGVNWPVKPDDYETLSVPWHLPDYAPGYGPEAGASPVTRQAVRSAYNQPDNMHPNLSPLNKDASWIFGGDRLTQDLGQGNNLDPSYDPWAAWCGFRGGDPYLDPGVAATANETGRAGSKGVTKDNYLERAEADLAKFNVERYGGQGVPVDEVLRTINTYRLHAGLDPIKDWTQTTLNDLVRTEYTGTAKVLNRLGQEIKSGVGAVGAMGTRYLDVVDEKVDRAFDVADKFADNAGSISMGLGLGVGAIVLAGLWFFLK